MATQSEYAAEMQKEMAMAKQAHEKIMRQGYGIESEPASYGVGERDPQVLRKLRELDASIELTQDRVTMLEERLGCVMMPPAPLLANESPVSPETLAPLAEQVSRQVDRVRFLHSRLATLMDRLEV